MKKIIITALALTFALPIVATAQSAEACNRRGGVYGKHASVTPMHRRRRLRRHTPQRYQAPVYRRGQPRQRYRQAPAPQRPRHLNPMRGERRGYRGA